ncbi:alpha-mannosidase [Dapis sp. BLCC M172]|uniref:alpha-mannosidase n=1 Tax=Dapis sp. BLCC M172 TaxID=2975281 RepID=UPI003CF5240A
MQFSIPEISKTIQKLRKLTQVDIQNKWRYWQKDIPIIALKNLDDWDLATTNERKHIAWEKGKQVLWLGQKLIIPPHLNGYLLTDLSLRLGLTWWAQSAEVYVNGKLVQTGDLFDCSSRILLSQKAVVGETFIIGIKLVSPEHDRGALVKSWCVYENLENYQLDPGLMADRLEILLEYLTKVESESYLNLEIIKKSVSLIDWQTVGEREKFERSLLKLHSEITKISDNYINSLKVKLLGHAHLDLAWLWDVEETWEAAQRTFTSVLNLQEDFPELIFCHSTPALYEWIEKNRPDLFNGIKRQIDLDKWEVAAGLWVEPELNTVGGESIVRQVLYGQRYVWEKFGRFSPVAWLPDTFGFCWQLPQILQGGNIKYFATQKLRWNDSTEFPFEFFWWEAPDKSRILSLMLLPIGESIEPVKMAKYACEWFTKTGNKNVLWLSGVGDHGGGPTRDMLEVGRRWQESGFFPVLEFSTAENFLTELVEANLGIFPIWQDELYLEFHRGCYTTHADQKRWNRRCENLLYQAELFSVFASIMTDSFYRKNDLEMAWKLVLFNQFHDILPGSAIPEVYVDANNNWREVERLGKEILAEAMTKVAVNIDVSPPFLLDAFPGGMVYPIVVFNSLNWQRSELISVALPALPTKKDFREQGESFELENGDEEREGRQGRLGGKGRETISKSSFSSASSLRPNSEHLSSLESRDDDWQVYDNAREILTSQVSDNNLLFVASEIPGVGYRVFWLCSGFSDLGNKPHIRTNIAQYTEKIAKKIENVNTVSLEKEKLVLENNLLRVKVEGATGNLESIFDKINQREVLRKPEGNKLQAFRDEGQYWDAWNIDPNYQQHPLSPAKLIDIFWVEQGELKSCLRVIRKIGNSEFRQDYILEIDSPLLKIKSWVNWQEKHTLVKAAFPINIEADFATYEIPCGAIKRTTKPQTEREKAKWEVPALHWADISKNNYGVSLLNDCKYGYDAKPDELRLTLLRGSTWPDSEADVGIHEFTYAIYPHIGSWENAGTVQRGYELNMPLLVQIMPLISKEKSHGNLPQTYRFLGWETENLILMALKRSEDNQRWIFRCYECLGREAKLNLESDAGLGIGKVVNLLEQDVSESNVEVESKSCEISPWKIVSFSLDF